jgi:hypothetical protein
MVPWCLCVAMFLGLPNLLLNFLWSLHPLIYAIWKDINLLLFSYVWWNVQKVDEKTINEVFLKVLDNYIKWCRYLRTRVAWNRSLLELSLALN